MLEGLGLVGSGWSVVVCALGLELVGSGWSVVVCAFGFGVGGLGLVGPCVCLQVWYGWVGQVSSGLCFEVGGTYPNPPMLYLQAQTTTDQPQPTSGGLGFGGASGLVGWGWSVVVCA